MFVPSQLKSEPSYGTSMASLPNPSSENKLLARLPAEERERLTPYLKPVDLHMRQLLVEFEYPIQYVYFLETAVTSTVVRTPHGETLEVGIMGAEGFVGLSLLYGVERSNGTVVVQVPGRALRMKAADFHQHVKSKGGALLRRFVAVRQLLPGNGPAARGV